MSDLLKRLNFTVSAGVIGPGSSEHEYHIAEAQVREAMSHIKSIEKQNAELRDWANTPPDMQERFMQVWRACIRLSDKAGFKALFRHFEEIENRAARAEKENAELRAALRDLWAYGGGTSIGKTYNRMFLEKHPEHPAVIERLQEQSDEK